MSRRRRILALVNRLPFPLDDGWKVRTFHVLRSIAQQSDLTVLSFTGPGESADGLREAIGGEPELFLVSRPAQYRPWQLAAGLLSRLPVHVWNLYSGAFQARLAQLMSRPNTFDAALCVLTFLEPYLGPYHGRVPWAIDTHNIDSANMERYRDILPHGPRRWYAGATAARMRRHEGLAFTRAREVWCCSSEDADLALQRAPSAQTFVIPNGVDTTAFTPSAGSDDRSTILFFGKLDYFPNVDALEVLLSEIFPAIRSEVSEVELQVVGPGGSPDLVRRLHHTPGVRHLGRVEDVRGPLENASVVVVPLRAGGGTRLKILEAMSMAKAIVSTPVGAEGLTDEAHTAMVLAKEPSRFATEVVSLLRDPARRRNLGFRARQVATTTFDWQLIGTTVMERLDRLAAGRS